jgi:UDP-N-acetylmuramoyl-L-alanyl-D-glutamate--2,6-diaminopimelate ligase
MRKKRQLGQLINGLEYQLRQGEIEQEIQNLTYDSRQASAGDIFICIRGAQSDGHQYIPDVIAKGVAVLVVQDEVQAPPTVTVIQVTDTRFALAQLSAAWFNYPAREMKIIGITGTKGKTTTTYLIRSMLEQAGNKVGLIGTIETIIGSESIPANNTTPESYLIQQYFRKMADAGCTTVVMEVSSQGLMMHRTAGFQFDIGIFTNIEPDHIGPNEHATFAEYLSCKSKLFQQCNIGIINIDDEHYQEVIAGHTCKIETFGFSAWADLFASNIKLMKTAGHLGVEYQTNGLLSTHIEIDVPGKFSIYNSLTAIAVCRHFQVETETMKKALKHAHVKGRIELVPLPDAMDFTLMIDYAHNAMSLESLLETLKEYEPRRLICLFGCGGNRSPIRRYEMGEVAGKLADITIITSDNPRHEKPEQIIKDIITGIEKTKGQYIEIVDRTEAIRYAITHGESGDIIVLAGKGHEDYQEIAGKKYPMDEREIIRTILTEI